jgi:hypothetical protein
MKVQPSPGIIGKRDGIDQAAAFRSTSLLNAAARRPTFMALQFVTEFTWCVLG